MRVRLRVRVRVFYACSCIRVVYDDRLSSRKKTHQNRGTENFTFTSVGVSSDGVDIRSIFNEYFRTQCLGVFCSIYESCVPIITRTLSRSTSDEIEYNTVNESDSSVVNMKDVLFSFTY